MLGRERAVAEAVAVVAFFRFGAWDVLGGVILSGIASDGGETIDGLRADSIELDWRTMMQPIFHSGRAHSLAKRIVDLCGGSAIRRVHLHRPLWGRDGWDGLDTKENVGSLDFGRDTNRLDYFRVTPFDVHESNDLRGIANYGGGFRTGQVSVENSSYNGRGGGGCRDGRSGRGEMVGPRLYREMGSTGASGGDRTRQVAVGIFANNDVGGGEVVVQRLEQERGGAATVDGSERWIDEEEGGGLVVAEWWNNWWLLLALWK
ncbi:hypothetical protein L6452_40725 [Arctium lappa]|uniref:Uncharacterized protein n=1 Tax=Arctium lappa TaxID=4217 RepID=A0ACB8XNV8_ARCLA|nr:hypothetical protein L6452_40725 [Arctium lappa]